MHYGLQIAKSAAATGIYRQNVHANNLANINTPGFKPDVPMVRERAVAREEDGELGLPSNRMLEVLGAGSFLEPNRINFGQGSLEQTGDTMDVAISGSGFFALQDAQGDIALTRDGRFTIDGAGRLVARDSGRPVLNRQQQELFLNDTGEVAIARDGRITQDVNGTPITMGYVGLFGVEDPQTLRKLGEGLFELPDGAGSLQTADGEVRQRYLERSNVNEISAMLAVQGAGKSAQGAIRMVRYHGEMMQQAISRFGRLA